MILPSAVRSGVMPSISWTPPLREAEAGHDLVEDEERAVRVQVASRTMLQEARLGQDEPDVRRIGLEDDARRSAPGLAAKAASSAAGSLNGQDHRLPRERRGDAGAVRDGRGSGRPSPP